MEMTIFKTDTTKAISPVLWLEIALEPCQLDSKIEDIPPQMAILNTLIP